jgi:hypothetical protein
VINHPFISDLSNKSLDELLDTIAKLNKNLQYMYRLGRSDMVNQISMAINTYKAEYNKRQQELWEQKYPRNLEKKIDIS